MKQPCMHTSTILPISLRAGGPSEISRWRKPPVRIARESEPRQGRDQRTSIPGDVSPLPGLLNDCFLDRWLTPPANFSAPCRGRLVLLMCEGCVSRRRDKSKLASSAP